MMSLRLPLSGLLMVSMLLPFSAFAAATTPTCTDAVYGELGQEERMYRSVIFGLATATDMPVNGSLTDKAGDTWLKTGPNNWQSPDRTISRDDATMELQRDVPARRGILEIRSALTSELIPPAVQAVRAMQCRMQAVCETARLSGQAGDSQSMNVQPDGCIAFSIEPIDVCRGGGDRMTTGDTQCSNEVDAIVDRESRMLELIVAYDASYRSLMQFAGTFEGFLTDFRFPLLQPLWQMVRTFGQFDNLPCFQAECNE